MTVYVVRHAHAGKRSAWPADDHRRPLSDKGRRQALALVEQLGDRHIERILSSPYDRCVQTVQPLAAARALDVERHEDLIEATPRDRVRDLLWSVGDDEVVLCSHGDVIGDLISELRLQGLDDLPQSLEWAKGSTWALEVNGRGVDAASYLPPPAD